MQPWIINLQRINLWRLSMCLKIEITIDSDGRPTEIFVFSVKVVNSRFLQGNFWYLKFSQVSPTMLFPCNDMKEKN